MPQLNWSHFKPEFAGKPDEDVETHLLRTNHWMDTLPFQKVSKSQKFCLTLVVKARIWYESLRVLLWIGMVYKISLGDNIQR